MTELTEESQKSQREVTRKESDLQVAETEKDSAEKKYGVSNENIASDRKIENVRATCGRAHSQVTIPQMQIQYIFTAGQPQNSLRM